MSIDYSNVTIALSMMSTTAFFTSFIEPLFFKRKIIAHELLLSILRSSAQTEYPIKKDRTNM